jgi:PhnB protein
MPAVIQPYLMFPGCTEEALNFYREVLGAQTEMLMRFSEAPDPPPPGMVPPGYGRKIMHASVRIGESLIMASDGDGPDTRFSGFSLSLSLPDEAEVRRVFAALGHGGSVQMPPGPTFWSPCFGMLTDRYGLRWMLGVEAPATVAAGAMRTQLHTIRIAAPRAKVWQTAEFSEGSTYEGSWDEGARIRFGVQPGGDGIVSMVTENRRHELVSLRHLGEIKAGVEDTSSPAAARWAGALERYRFVDGDQPGITEVTVVSEVPGEYAGYMREAWPKALGKLKALCEAARPA